MSLIQAAQRGIVVRGAFDEAGRMGQHYCALELMSIFKVPNDTIGAITSLHLEFVVFEGPFVQGASLALYLGPHEGPERHAEDLRRMVNDWHAESPVFPEHDQPLFLAVHREDRYLPAPPIHSDIIEVISASIVAIRRDGARKNGGERKAYWEMADRLTAVKRRIRRDSFRSTAVQPLF